MESPPVSRYMPHNSKKRVFPGESSMDPDVVEICPPVNRSSKAKPLKNKEVILHEVIDVDMVEDSGDVMLTEGKVDKYNKGKEAMVINSSETSSAVNLGSADGVQSSKKSSAPKSHNVINLDGLSSDLSYGDDEYMDMYIDNLMDDDEYTILQSHFDNIDIPPGVEAPIPWFPGPLPNNSSLATTSSSGQSVLQILPNAGGFKTASRKSHSLWPAEATRKRFTPESSATKKTPIHAVGHPHKVKLSSPPSSTKTAQSKKGIASSTSSNYLGLKTRRGAGEYKKATVSGSTNNYKHNPLGSIKQYPGIEPSAISAYFPNSTMKQIGSDGFLSTSYLPKGAINHVPGMDTYVPNWFKSYQSMMGTSDYPGFIDSFHTDHSFPEEAAFLPFVQDSSISQNNVADLEDSLVQSGSSSGLGKHGNEAEILEKFQLFKKFDTVQVDSDHCYVHNGSSLKQPSKNWAKRIQEEWKILEKDLPDTIFVRVYESRMDLLRAVIIGAEGTPYHDGLFFFDVFFPSSYPNVPPQVYYHSGGLRLNPNLYACGKVCLSLLNTWGGSQKEKWIPGLSTMLQVLVSIQGLILNAKPFFNEPGYAHTSGTANGEKNSLQYNESTFILSLKTMVYTMRRPPKHFEDFVVGYFFKHAQDVLVACKAYMDGAQVGCLVRGGVQDVDEGDKSCSEHFKGSLGSYMKTLVNAFTEFGVKDCEKFIPPAQTGSRQTGSRQVSPALKAVNFYHY